MYIKYKCTVVSSNCGAMVELQATFSTKNIHYQKKKKNLDHNNKSTAHMHVCSGRNYVRSSVHFRAFYLIDRPFSGVVGRCDRTRG